MTGNSESKATETPKKKYENPLRDKLNILVELFIVKGANFSWNSKDISREMAATKRLTNEFPDFEFFYTLIDLQQNFNSLLGLLGKYWKPKLIEKYRQFVIDKNNKNEYILSDKSLINLEIKEEKPKNILEFVK